MGIDKKTFRSGPYKDFFAQGVQAGNVLYLAGQVGADKSGAVSEDIVKQTDQAYRNIREVLNAFGATMDNVVDETWFVTSIPEIMANAETIFGARAACYGGVPEVSQTLVQVSGLVMPELKIEIKCIAHLTPVA